MKREHAKIRVAVVICALFVFIFTNLFSLFIFKHIPRVHDEIANVFQAKIFKSGQLYVPSPCEKDFFQFTHIINNGKWYSQYTPGYPFLLFLGLLLGMPWIVNPLLASLAVILFYFLGKELYSRRVGLFASLLGAVSVWFLLMSSTMMSHTGSLFFTTLFLLFLFRSEKKPSILNGILAGAGLGMAFLIRPYNAVFISFPFLLFFSMKVFQEFRPRLKNALALSLTALIFVSVLMAYNQVTNGNPLRMGYIVSYGEDHGIGFGRAGYTGIPHTPFLGAINAGNYLLALNRDVFGWPLSSFLALLPLLWVWRIKPEERRKDLLLASGFFSLLAGLFIYWGTFVFIGARMCFETLPLIILLSARGVTELPGLLSLKLKNLSLSWAKKAVAALLIIFTMYAFAVHFRRWVWPRDTEWYFDGFSNNFAGVTTRIHQTMKSLLPEQSVVILKFLYHPFEYFPYGWWGSGFLYNDPSLKGDIIYGLDQGRENWKLFRCFPERKIFLFFGTLEKGMLIQLKMEGTQLIYGEPLSSENQGNRSIELLKSPLEFYKVYSSEFKDFLFSLYEKNDFLEIDVAHLVETGTLCEKEKRYREAAFYFEAALQIDKNPEIVYPVLNQLSACYFKAGEFSAAKKLSEGLRNFKKPKISNLIPERGI